MIKRVLLVGSLAAASCLSFRAADTGGGAGGGEPEKKDGDTDPEEKPEDEKPEEEPKVEGDTIESKLASATGHLKRIFGRLQATLGANKRLQQQFDAMKLEAETAKREATQAKKDLTGEKDAHKLTSEKLSNTEKDVERLEGLCGLRGLDKKTVIAPTGGPSTDVKAEYGELREKEGKGQAPRGTSSKFYKQHKKELDSAK